MFVFPEPPYFMLIAGLLASLAAGVAFSATLKQLVQGWSANPPESPLPQAQRFQLLLPFVGIAGGACVFLASGIQIFGFPRGFAYGLALPMTLLIGQLVWRQLLVNLSLLLKGGSAALDLDVMS